MKNTKLIAVAKKAAKWLHNIDLGENPNPAYADEAQNLANELETAINEEASPVKPSDLLKGFGTALRKAGYIQGGR